MRDHKIELDIKQEDIIPINHILQMLNMGGLTIEYIAKELSASESEVLRLKDIVCYYNAGRMSTYGLLQRTAETADFILQDKFQQLLDVQQIECKRQQKLDTKLDQDIRINKRSIIAFWISILSLIVAIIALLK